MREREKRVILKIFNRLAISLTSILRFIAVILTLLVLIFIVKWRINNLFEKNISETTQGTTLTEEIKSSKEQLGEITESAKKASQDIKTVTIPPQPEAEDVATILFAEGIIDDEEEFTREVHHMGRGHFFTQGEFEISKDMTTKDLIKVLTEPGFEAAKRVVHLEIPNGADASIVGKILEDEELVESKGAFVDLVKAQAEPVEFIPGGYNIQVPIKNQELLEILTGQRPSNVEEASDIETTENETATPEEEIPSEEVPAE